MPGQELKYLIALTLVPLIGSITARKLIAYTGSAEAVFSEKKNKLLKIPGIGQILAENTRRRDVLEKAEKELDFISRRGIGVKTIFEDDYPERLKQCADAPLVLFYRGLGMLNYPRILSVVGTRSASEYGSEMCRKIIKDLAEFDNEIVIISGLAYGIDYHAHMSALRTGLKTIAVLAHGLHTIYPAIHSRLASDIMINGTLLTDFTTRDNPERNNFLKRNRIIAGLADATVVVESGKKGGALITADFALSYNRDVFALPGRVNDQMSEGCNTLIKENKAALVEGAKDILYFLGWDKTVVRNVPRQSSLFTELSSDEEAVIRILREEDKLGPDIISVRAGLPVSRVSAAVLGLEFKALVSVQPGNIIRLS